jgi:allantoate deiminase
VGTLVARNRPAGEKVFGVGSHCDSNRNGGKYDGTMSVVTALEICRLNRELGLDRTAHRAGTRLQVTGNRLDIVNAIAGYVHTDIVVDDRSDHAGATPMDFRQDAGLVAAECMLELERLAREAEGDTVGTVGEIELKPGLINAVSGEARFSLDIRGVDEEAFRGVAHDIAAFAERAAGERGMTTEYRQRQALSPAPLDERVTGALETAAEATGEPYM